MQYTDTTLMPFGVHKGKALANTPGKYLLWLYEQEWLRNSSYETHKALVAYIKENKAALELETDPK